MANVPFARLYQIARNKYITLIAIILEILMLVSCILLADALIEEVLHIQTMLATHVPLKATVIAVLALQYMIAITEFLASFREDRRGFTLPIVFFPGGIILRAVIMAILALVVIAYKLCVYFVSVLFQFVFQILRIDKHVGTAHQVDAVDRHLEPLEIWVNRVYNRFYFHKIHANSSVFTTVFNGSLSLWCINH
ncbi:MAG: hypothetical protein IKY83_07495 [Proteobacteria bacterium]|nr:hypothetical protein [Pseudomonadota bacterium]